VSFTLTLEGHRPLVRIPMIVTTYSGGVTTDSDRMLPRAHRIVQVDGMSRARSDPGWLRQQ